MTSAEEFIPKSQEELCEFLKTNANGLKKQIYVSGNGNNIPDTFRDNFDGIVINLSAMNQLIDFPSDDMTVTVQAGMTLSELSEIVSSKNLNLPIDINYPEKNSTGGIYATNPFGSHILGRGTLRDYVIGITAVNSEGKLFHSGGRVVKNVAGYDLCKLLLGSYGTLVIVTELTFKLIPIPESVRTATIHFIQHEEIETFLTYLNTSAIRPVICDIFNRKSGLKINHQLQEQNKKPINEDYPYSLILGFEGFSKEVDWSLDQLKNDMTTIQHSSIEYLDEGLSKEIINIITRFSEFTSGNLSIQIKTSPSKTAETTEYISEQGFAIQTHAGNGIIKGSLLCQENKIDQLSHQLGEISKKVLNQKGYFTIPEYPLEWKENFTVWGEPAASWTMMNKLKNTFDPNSLLYSDNFIPMS